MKTKTEVTHTPTPNLQIKKIDARLSYSEAAYFVQDEIDVNRSFSTYDEDFAAFIVRAVNSHEKFMALARYVLADQRARQDLGEILSPNDRIISQLAIEALAKAEGR